MEIKKIRKKNRSTCTHGRPLRVLILAPFLYEVKGYFFKKSRNIWKWPFLSGIFFKNECRSFDRSFEASRSDPRPTKTLKKTHKMVKRSKRLRLSRGKFHHTSKKPPKRRQSGTPSAYVFLRLINVLKKVRCVLFCLKRVLIKALHLFTLVRLDFRMKEGKAAIFLSSLCGLLWAFCEPSWAFEGCLCD